ncbi:hypothetical protein SAMN05216474_0144 [Lishizhenia tianjinensis]|uniref:Pirin family protein n=2 Tax=Lishizhenia tianjinensis TaxID=477690 RepID=A0A1I6XFA0_9FLAO|nr:pirin family protein [Lishizhenia tianjinensis]SFT36751.1 hypothetical protein SAMN05216474_0144 [Lishizhenia tianjinensis]
MKRDKFLKSVFGVSLLGMLPSSSKGLTKDNQDEKLKIEGFNHIPTKEEKKMNTILHKADTRGLANHGWLVSRHTFSFANYYNPERMHFGVLRVLNDDLIAKGTGFPKHPHDNMEIVSIPLKGNLEHKDSMGNTAIIKEGNIQVMSAGTGVMHSEYNQSKEEDCSFLQIWVIPKKRNVEPRYDQVSISELMEENAFSQILSPNADDQGVWIHQNAWFHMGNFEENKEGTYTLKDKSNGVYLFVLEGEMKVNDDITLEKRDGLGIKDIEEFKIKTNKKTKVLVMEVPELI